MISPELTNSRPAWHMAVAAGSLAVAAACGAQTSTSEQLPGRTDSNAITCTRANIYEDPNNIYLSVRAVDSNNKAVDAESAYVLVLDSGRSKHLELKRNRAPIKIARNVAQVAVQVSRGDSSASCPTIYHPFRAIENE